MKRLIFVGIILFVLAYLSFYVSYHHIQTPQGLSFETLFRYAGQPVKTVDRSLTRVLGVNAKDERELGDFLAKSLEPRQVQGMLSEKTYVNGVIQELAKQYNPKKLNYKVYIFDGAPNAFALAGGNIIITTGMLSLLKSESELVAILGHEKGHIELGHCIDHMRIQAKTYQSQFGAFFDWYLSMLLNHTFSKFQENEADRFGFETLIALQYDSSAMGMAFTRMQQQYSQTNNNTLNPIKDYFMTHPSLNIRAENWTEKAKRWKQQNASMRYYIGIQNYIEKIPKSVTSYPQEWNQGLLLEKQN